MSNNTQDLSIVSESLIKNFGHTIAQNGGKEKTGLDKSVAT